jgi:hypothetical protein
VVADGAVWVSKPARVSFSRHTTVLWYARRRRNPVCVARCLITPGAAPAPGPHSCTIRLLVLIADCQQDLCRSRRAWRSRTPTKLPTAAPAPAPGRPLRDSRKSEIDAFNRAGALPRSASRRLAMTPTRTPAGIPAATATAPADISRHLIGGRRDVDCNATHGGSDRGGHAEGPYADGREQQKNVWFHANGLVTGRRVRQKKNGAIRSWRTSKEEPHQVPKSRGDI